MATGSVQPFYPIDTITLSGTTLSTTGTLASMGDSVLIFNAASVAAFIELGTVSSLAQGTPVPAGGRQLFAAGPYVTLVSAILPSGAGTIYATAGNGTAW